MPDDDKDLIIGRFSLDADAFRVATEWLEEHLRDPGIKQIILDEVGPLEMKGQGRAEWLRSAIPALEEKTMILVVRRSLLDKVVSAF